ncbi:MAG: hypothetical protein GX277_04200 [Bacteroidales bacterium]|nr:hypothetical protein [Bacteroidales bacterium]
MTGNVSFVRHLYEVQRELKTYTVFELKESHAAKQPTPPILTDIIRVEVFRGFSYGKGFLHYLRIRNANAWSKCELVTGLFKTESEQLFHGNRIHRGQKHLIIFWYSLDKTKLCIDYFPNYNPNKCDLTALLTKYIEVIEKTGGRVKRPPITQIL